MTAVEWLYNNLNLCFDKFDNGEYSYTEFINASKEVKEQAKQMEKQQIVNTCIIADSESTQEDSEHNALKFYERTYGSKGNDETKQ